MSKNPFGWSLPPGVTQRMIDEQLEGDEPPDEGGPNDDDEHEEMRGDAYIYKVDGTMEHKKLNAPTLSVIRSAVGGSIEAVPYWTTHHGKPCVAFCNEEGKLNELPYNVMATALWYIVAPQMRGHDVLVGDIIVLSGNDAFMEAI